MQYMYTCTQCTCMKAEGLTDLGSFMYLYHRREALSWWKARLGSGATYRVLIEMFFRAGKVHLADFVRELLSDIGYTSGMI